LPLYFVPINSRTVLPGLIQQFIYKYHHHYSKNMHTHTQISINPIRETLFGDMPIDSWANHSNAEPWTSFAKAKAEIERDNKQMAAHFLQQVIQMPGLESRHYLQAHHFMRQLGYQMNQEKELLGVVVEVAMPEGLDLLAAYSDYTARYYNFSGAGIIWERPDTSINKEITQVLQSGQVIMNRIGRWEGERPQAPRTGHARINLLTNEGLHFGEGPMSVLMNDTLGGPMLKAAINLMSRLINVAEAKK
jgi:hypothetical protein